MPSVSLSARQRNTLVAAATVIAELVDASDAAMAQAITHPPRGGEYSAADRKRVLAEIRRARAAKHPHPLTAASRSTGVARKTVKRWAAEAGLI